MAATKKTGAKKVVAKRSPDKTAADVSEKKTPPRRDGRVSTLIYMKSDILDEARGAAAANEQPAWRFIERAVQDALKKAKRKV